MSKKKVRKNSGINSAKSTQDIQGHTSTQAGDIYYVFLMYISISKKEKRASMKKTLIHTHTHSNIYFLGFGAKY